MCIIWCNRNYDINLIFNENGWQGESFKMATMYIHEKEDSLLEPKRQSLLDIIEDRLRNRKTHKVC